MEQPTQFAIQYIAGISVKKGTVYTSASILSTYPTANVLKMKTSGVSVSINGTEMFQTSYDDESFIVTGLSYVFNKDCVVAVGKYIGTV